MGSALLSVYHSVCHFVVQLSRLLGGPQTPDTMCYSGEDERDAIQKKTFTKWVNKHLKKAGRNVRDLFEDLRDGHNLLSLLEVLSGEILPRERGRMRFHAIQNVETALRFLRYKEIKLVNIRGEDIVDGNPKLTLGLIWTIILHFQVGSVIFYTPNMITKIDMRNSSLEFL